MKGWVAATAATAGLLVLLTACESETDYAKASGAGGKSAQTAAAAPRLLETMQYRAAPAPGSMVVVAPPPAGDRFPAADPNKWQASDKDPVSTFSIDVDTASYAYVRRLLREGQLPPRDAVRVEEMVNYFPYAYPGPASAAEPFRASVTVLPSPWNEGARLLHVGLKGWDLPHAQRPRANLTFLIDVSGSMASDDKLPLIQKALQQLGEGLRPDDTVAIVTYAGQSGVALPPTKGREIKSIMAAVKDLGAGGSTAGEAGIRKAYDLAEQMFDAEAVNRVILATDGDFNVGEFDPRRLEELIAEKRRTGVYLTILGVGQGNLNDTLMQRLAQAGNGQAAYIDSLLEARKVWIEELGSTMFPIADDVKIQVEFNPAKVAEYRLVGYETRLLERADFSNDRVDAGEIGSGHSVTALYEFRPVGAPGILNEPLRYGQNTFEAKLMPAAAKSGELAFLRLRYKQPRGEKSALIERPVTETDGVARISDAPEDVRFAVAVAGFGQMLRKDESVDSLHWDDVARLARGARGEPPGGDITIHGLPNGREKVGEWHRTIDWTAGCIAMTNKEIEEIWRVVPIGTPIEIRP